MKRFNNWVKTFSVALGFLYFFTQVAFAYSSETNFWSERRKNARSSRLENTPLQLAALPGPQQIINQLPQVTRQILAPTLPQNVSKNLPAGFMASQAELLNALPQAYGSVRKITLPASRIAAGNLPIVVHVQDVHGNLEAQKNIGSAIQSLIDQKQVRLVALEGRPDPLPLERIRAYPGRGAIREVADCLLREHKITGPAYAAMTSRAEIPPFVGIDDAAHHQAHVEAYRRSAAILKEMKGRWSSGQSALAVEKARVFSPALLAFDRTVTGYHEGKVSLSNYVSELTRRGPEKAVGPDLRDFIQALKMENSLDLKRVEAERARLIERLVRQLTQRQISSLLQRGMAYRMGQIRYGEFYGYLKKLCGSSGIDLSSLPSLNEYIKYVLLSDGLDADRLMEGTGNLEKIIYARLARTPEEAGLVEKSGRALLTGKLLDFSLTPREWADYLSSLQPSPLRGEEVRSFEDFYREAQLRDGAMASNLLRAMKTLSRQPEGRPPVAVLVTGGYHAPGITERLNRVGVAVISYVPKIEKIDAAQGSQYLSVFTQEKTPLEKLFEGEKLFLGVDPAPRDVVEGFVPAGVAAARLLDGGDEASARRDFASIGGGRDLTAIREAGGSVVTTLRGLVEITWSRAGGLLSFGMPIASASAAQKFRTGARRLRPLLQTLGAALTNEKASTKDAYFREKWKDNPWKYRLYTVFGVNWESIHQRSVLIAFLFGWYFISPAAGLAAGAVWSFIAAYGFAKAHPGEFSPRMYWAGVGFGLAMLVPGLWEFLSTLSPVIPGLDAFLPEVLQGSWFKLFVLPVLFDWLSHSLFNFHALLTGKRPASVSQRPPAYPGPIGNLLGEIEARLRQASRLNRAEEIAATRAVIGRDVTRLIQGLAADEAPRSGGRSVLTADQANAVRQRAYTYIFQSLLDETDPASEDASRARQSNIRTILALALLDQPASPELLARTAGLPVRALEYVSILKWPVFLPRRQHRDALDPRFRDFALLQTGKSSLIAIASHFLNSDLINLQGLSPRNRNYETSVHVRVKQTSRLAALMQKFQSLQRSRQIREDRRPFVDPDITNKTWPNRRHALDIMAKLTAIEFNERMELLLRNDYRSLEESANALENIIELLEWAPTFFPSGGGTLTSTTFIQFNRQRTYARILDSKMALLRGGPDGPSVPASLTRAVDDFKRQFATVRADNFIAASRSFIQILVVLAPLLPAAADQRGQRVEASAQVAGEFFEANAPHPEESRDPGHARDHARLSANPRPSAVSAALRALPESKEGMEALVLAYLQTTYQTTHPHVRNEGRTTREVRTQARAARYDALLLIRMRAFLIENGTPLTDRLIERLISSDETRTLNRQLIQPLTETLAELMKFQAGAGRVAGRRNPIRPASILEPRWRTWLSALESNYGRNSPQYRGADGLYGLYTLVGAPILELHIHLPLILAIAVYPSAPFSIQLIVSVVAAVVMAFKFEKAHGGLNPKERWVIRGVGLALGAVFPVWLLVTGGFGFDPSALTESSGWIDVLTMHNALWDSAGLHAAYNALALRFGWPVAAIGERRASPPTAENLLEAARALYGERIAMNAAALKIKAEEYRSALAAGFSANPRAPPEDAGKMRQLHGTVAEVISKKLAWMDLREIDPGRTAGLFPSEEDQRRAAEEMGRILSDEVRRLYEVTQLRGRAIEEGLCRFNAGDIEKLFNEIDSYAKSFPETRDSDMTRTVLRRVIHEADIESAYQSRLAMFREARKWATEGGHKSHAAKIAHLVMDLPLRERDRGGHLTRAQDLMDSYAASLKEARESGIQRYAGSIASVNFFRPHPIRETKMSVNWFKRIAAHVAARGYPVFAESVAKELISWRPSKGESDDHFEERLLLQADRLLDGILVTSREAVEQGQPQMAEFITNRVGKARPSPAEIAAAIDQCLQGDARIVAGGVMGLRSAIVNRLKIRGVDLVEIERLVALAKSLEKIALDANAPQLARALFNHSIDAVDPVTNANKLISDYFTVLTRLHGRPHLESHRAIAERVLGMESPLEEADRILETYSRIHAAQPADLSDSAKHRIAWSQVGNGGPRADAGDEILLNRRHAVRAYLDAQPPTLFRDVIFEKVWRSVIWREEADALLSHAAEIQRVLGGRGAKTDLIEQIVEEVLTSGHPLEKAVQLFDNYRSAAGAVGISGDPGKDIDPAAADAIARRAMTFFNPADAAEQFKRQYLRAYRHLRSRLIKEDDARRWALQAMGFSDPIQAADTLLNVERSNIKDWLRIFSHSKEFPEGWNPALDYLLSLNPPAFVLPIILRETKPDPATSAEEARRRYARYVTTYEKLIQTLPNDVALYAAIGAELRAEPEAAVPHLLKAHTAIQSGLEKTFGFAVARTAANLAVYSGNTSDEASADILAGAADPPDSAGPNDNFTPRAMARNIKKIKDALDFQVGEFAADKILMDAAMAVFIYRINYSSLVQSVDDMIKSARLMGDEGSPLMPEIRLFQLIKLLHFFYSREANAIVESWVVELINNFRVQWRDTSMGGNTYAENFAAGWARAEYRFQAFLAPSLRRTVTTMIARLDALGRRQEQAGISRSFFLSRTYEWTGDAQEQNRHLESMSSAYEAARKRWSTAPRYFLPLYIAAATRSVNPPASMARWISRYQTVMKELQEVRMPEDAKRRVALGASFYRDALPAANELLRAEKNAGRLQEGGAERGIRPGSRPSHKSRNGSRGRSNRNRPGSTFDDQVLKRWTRNSWQYWLYTVFGVNWESIHQRSVLIAFLFGWYFISPAAGLAAGAVWSFIAAYGFAKAHPGEFSPRMYWAGVGFGLAMLVPGLWEFLSTLSPFIPGLDAFLPDVLQGSWFKLFVLPVLFNWLSHSLFNFHALLTRRRPASIAEPPSGYPEPFGRLWDDIQARLQEYPQIKSARGMRTAKRDLTRFSNRLVDEMAEDEKRGNDRILAADQADRIRQELYAYFYQSFVEMDRTASDRLSRARQNNIRAFLALLLFNRPVSLHSLAIAAGLSEEAVSQAQILNARVAVLYSPDDRLYELDRRFREFIVTRIGALSLFEDASQFLSGDLIQIKEMSESYSGYEAVLYRRVMQMARLAVLMKRVFSLPRFRRKGDKAPPFPIIASPESGNEVDRASRIPEILAISIVSDFNQTLDLMLRNDHRSLEASADILEGLVETIEWTPVFLRLRGNELGRKIFEVFKERGSNPLLTCKSVLDEKIRLLQAAPSGKIEVPVELAQKIVSFNAQFQSVGPGNFVRFSREFIQILLRLAPLATAAADESGAEAKRRGEIARDIEETGTLRGDRPRRGHVGEPRSSESPRPSPALNRLSALPDTEPDMKSLVEAYLQNLYSTMPYESRRNRTIALQARMPQHDPARLVRLRAALIEGQARSMGQLVQFLTSEEERASRESAALSTPPLNQQLVRSLLEFLNSLLVYQEGLRQGASRRNPIRPASIWGPQFKSWLSGLDGLYGRRSRQYRIAFGFFLLYVLVGAPIIELVFQLPLFLTLGSYPDAPAAIGILVGAVSAYVMAFRFERAHGGLNPRERQIIWWVGLALGAVFPAWIWLTGSMGFDPSAFTEFSGWIDALTTHNALWDSVGLHALYNGFALLFGWPLAVIGARPGAPRERVDIRGATVVHVRYSVVSESIDAMEADIRGTSNLPATWQSTARSAIDLLERFHVVQELTERTHDPRIGAAHLLANWPHPQRAYDSVIDRLVTQIPEFRKGINLLLTRLFAIPGSRVFGERWAGETGPVLAVLINQDRPRPVEEIASSAGLQEDDVRRVVLEDLRSMVRVQSQRERTEVVTLKPELARFFKENPFVGDQLTSDVTMPISRPVVGLWDERGLRRPRAAKQDYPDWSRLSAGDVVPSTQYRRPLGRREGLSHRLDRYLSDTYGPAAVDRFKELPAFNAVQLSALHAMLTRQRLNVTVERLNYLLGTRNPALVYARLHVLAAVLSHGTGETGPVSAFLPSTRSAARAFFSRIGITAPPAWAQNAFAAVYEMRRLFSLYFHWDRFDVFVDEHEPANASERARLVKGVIGVLAATLVAPLTALSVFLIVDRNSVSDIFDGVVLLFALLAGFPVANFISHFVQDTRADKRVRFRARADAAEAATLFLSSFKSIDPKTIKTWLIPGIEPGTVEQIFPKSPYKVSDGVLKKLKENGLYKKEFQREFFKIVAERGRLQPTEDHLIVSQFEVTLSDLSWLGSAQEQRVTFVRDIIVGPETLEDGRRVVSLQEAREVVEAYQQLNRSRQANPVRVRLIPAPGVSMEDLWKIGERDANIFHRKLAASSLTYSALARDFEAWRNDQGLGQNTMNVAVAVIGDALPEADVAEMDTPYLRALQYLVPLKRIDLNRMVDFARLVAQFA